jgi:hypothetical protein
MDYACYITPSNTYIWTNKPMPNYILVPEIKTKADIPTVKPDYRAASGMNSNPTPTPTPNPGMPGPAPTPAPTPTPKSNPSDDLPGPQTTLTRFYSISETADHETLMDRETHYRIEHYKNSGDYIAFNEDGREVCHIYGDGTTSFSTVNFRAIVSKDKMTLNDIPIGQIVVKDANNGFEYVIDDRKVVKLTEFRNDGITDTHYYDENGNEKRVTSDGHTFYYERDGKDSILREAKHIYPDGTIGYKTESFDNFVITPDGKYTFYKGKKAETGKYEIDENGNFICSGEDGSVTIRNSKGHLLEKTDINDNTYYHDYKNKARVDIKNGKVNYSMINHIEYDEEAYDEILQVLNSIDGSSIKTACSNIESELSSLPDKCSSDVASVKSTIDGHIDLISSLSSITNYSLLAYQTCDESLKDNLNTLILSLFELKDQTIASSFINTIKDVIEDRDGDKVLEYKEGTNFDTLSKAAIIKSSFVDKNGTQLYFNENRKLIGMDGDSAELDFGGKKFTITPGKNGSYIVRDKDGNPLSIFGDYNVESSQYGGNQGDFGGSRGAKLLDDRNIQAVFNKYYPNATDEEKLAFMQKVNDTGCGNVAMTNIAFTKFCGDEEGFINTFGYPMYEVSYEFTSEGKVPTIDYNYEPLILDVFSYMNKKSDIASSTRAANGTSPWGQNQMTDYFKKEYGVVLENLPQECVYIGERGYTLYNMDGSVYYENGGGHAMVITGHTEDGTPIVSSWGDKFIFSESSGIIDRLVGAIDRKEFK